jgi:hypothetical protein
MRTFTIVLFAKHNQNNQVEEYEMGVACSKNGGEKRNRYRLLVGKPKGN